MQASQAGDGLPRRKRAWADNVLVGDINNPGCEFIIREFDRRVDKY